MKKMTFFILTLLVLSTISLQTAFAQEHLKGIGVSIQCRFRRMAQSLLLGLMMPQ